MDQKSPSVYRLGVVDGQTGRNPKVRVAHNSPTDRDFAVVSAMAIYRQLTQPLMQNSVVMKLVPAGATIAELEKMATDCEEKAKKEVEPEATKLREEAFIYREWITALRSGKLHE